VALARSIPEARNGVALNLSRIPSLPIEGFRSACLSAIAGGSRLAAVVLLPEDPAREPGEHLMAVLSDSASSRFGFIAGRVPESRRFLSLSTEAPEASSFEREILEDHGIVPEGHPWLKPLRSHAGNYAFFRVEGDGVHEVAVGPVHAGIIEPGHFRFQCHGERVLHLEIQLGYQHRGARELFLRSGPARRLVIAESVAGDTAVGHAVAYCEAIEGLSGTEAPLDAQRLRGIALELERIANHVGDLGALCGDVGYLPGAAWFGRLRGEALGLLLEISGNRFGRGLLIPGGVRFGIEAASRRALREQLDHLEADFSEVAEMVFEAPSVVARFEQTGILKQEDAVALGVVGPSARASGVDRDARRDHPAGIYRFAHIPTALQESGDVMGRAVVRRLEVERSLQFVREHLTELTEGPLTTRTSPARPNACLVSAVEGWRGEIVHLAITGYAGEIASYTIVDPSFHNWHGLALAMRERQISDFPLCNKSFNLSYAGHDL